MLLKLTTTFAGLMCQAAMAQSGSDGGFASGHWWPPSQRQAQIAYEAGLNGVPSPLSLRAYHDLLASEPHIAGTPGDQRTIERLVEAFMSLGLAVQTHEFWAYLSKPIDAKLELLTLEPIGIGEHQELQLHWKPQSLSIKEDVSGWSAHPDLTFGFNAYSGTGEITAEVVYANYGTKADFQKLRKLNIDCAGKIVLARYGGNFRGYKAKFAQAAGAAGLIIYTDPDDSGYRQGLPYPEGGWANESCIQRGSINTLDYPGDPLTPGEPATEHAPRLDPSGLALPSIPVQPIGYGAARQIMQHMKGEPLPHDLVKTWQGGLPFAYRLTGGNKLKLRLMVKQERSITKSANVIATLRGSTEPDQKVIIGCHHDAWGFGAADPLAGLIVLMESAKSFADAARHGHRPRRSLVFAAWGAEEYGIIGSTEYCEQYRDDLIQNAVAYINLDMAAMGPDFGSSASPSLKRIIQEAARDVPHMDGQAGRTVSQAWLGEKKEPSFGDLGGGSDHVGFYCHLGIPSCSIGAGGSHGTSYHSNYDTLEWYRKVVGEDYHSARMLTRVVNVLAARLANGAVLPIDPVRYALDAKVHLQTLAGRAKELKLDVDFTGLISSIDGYQQRAEALAERLQKAVDAGELNEESLQQINQVLLKLERQWLLEKGPDPAVSAAWFRNAYARSDPESGYAAWMLPGIRQAIEDSDPISCVKVQQAYHATFQHLIEEMATIDRILSSSSR